MIPIQVTVSPLTEVQLAQLTNELRIARAESDSSRIIFAAELKQLRSELDKLRDEVRR